MQGFDDSIAVLNIPRKNFKIASVSELFLYYKELHERFFPENFLDIFRKAVFLNTFGLLLVKEANACSP